MTGDGTGGRTPYGSGMRRQVSLSLNLDVAEPATVVLSVAVAARPAVETLTVMGDDGAPVAWREIAGPHGGRLHVVDAPAGPLAVSYAATVEGHIAVPGTEEVDRLVALRPSRYCPSDRLGVTARAEFGELEGTDLVTAVRTWVANRLVYISGASGPTDDAVDTLLLGEGVCRDYAHLVAAMLRARDVPARLASVYAPGLSPMDFHAVVEAWVDGSWQLTDATGLAPRASMLRIATGADAADTAFVSTHGGAVELTSIDVLAVADVLPAEDLTATVELT